ncbi:MAG: hypothetical protein K5660_07635 [Paludibacteraceae bacterium]|nr:hypothetical protein [Paludibacteraceae bacterium]
MKTKIYFSLAFMAITIFCDACSSVQKTKENKTEEQELTDSIAGPAMSSTSAEGDTGDILKDTERPVFTSGMQKISGKMPDNAKQIAHGKGWIVYKEDTEETLCYIASRIYLIDSQTQEIYFLLETKGDKQTGTKLPIKAQNWIAYNNDDEIERVYKEEASYENGYIRAIEEVNVLSHDKLLITGDPDCRNLYHYIINIAPFSAIHIPHYSGCDIVEKEGEQFLECSWAQYDYQNETRKCYKQLYDLDGNKVGDKKDITNEVEWDW